MKKLQTTGLKAGEKLEWLETNGLGAYASSTSADCHTRKYHGLFVSPLPGMQGRYHMLSALELYPEGHSAAASNHYPDVIFPDGYRNIKGFDMLPFPVWHYELKGLSVRKEVIMPGEESSVLVVFTLEEGAERINAGLKALMTFRDSHSLTRENPALKTELQFREDGIIIKPYEGFPDAALQFSGTWRFSGGFFWDRNIEYPEETERGLDYTEDRFVPGNIEIVLERGIPFIVRFSIEPLNGDVKSALHNNYEREKENRKKEADSVRNGYDLLALKGRSFMVINESMQKSVIAGYPWFGEWGRDTMLALPGLTFASGGHQEAVRVLTDYSALIRDGLLPNTLGGSQGYTSYNSVDAGLLFGWTLAKMMDMGFGESVEDDIVLRQKLLPAVGQIISAYMEGRVPDAGLDQEGFVHAGNPDTQLTWMDAKAYGRPVTPRWGAAVEINALWYNLLVLHGELCRRYEKKQDAGEVLIVEKFPAEFRKRFRLEGLGYLADTVSGGIQDGKLRPNMLFAASVRGNLLDGQTRKAVVRAAKDKLLTPMGLRTLSPDDPEFRPEYAGNMDERDSVYHQGTVWPWLIGIMVESSLNAAVDKKREALFWKTYLDNLLDKHLLKDGLGFVSEIFDGLVPDRGKGCIAQAWSTGEILRAAWLVGKQLGTAAEKKAAED